VVTSPPYFNLRDYETNHHREIGTESTVEQYVRNLVMIFRQVRRVLRADGTVWLNIGDTWDKEGCMAGVPWRTAWGLVGDGWILRQDVIWHRTQAVPDGTSNRCTQGHEYIFFLSNGTSYYFDQIANKETPTSGNRRSVWSIPTASTYSGGHFAKFPKKIPDNCISAATSEYGCCSECGSPYGREVEEVLVRDNPTAYTSDRYDHLETLDGPKVRSCPNFKNVAAKTLGWKQSCSCSESKSRPCVVLDPFIGSGTTAVAALNHGRHCIGIDLNLEYLNDHVIPRVEGALLERGQGHLAGREPVKIKSKGVTLG
jgi:site-specific DNA-methyltransferase (adenine-specific)